MSCHLSHQLSWNPLVAMYAVSKGQHEARHYIVPDATNWMFYCYKPAPHRFVGPLKQFALVLLRLLNEFAATDNSTVEEMQWYDPKVWGEYGLQTTFTATPDIRLGYHESLLWGYMTLNLLIADPERMRPVILPTQFAPTLIKCMLGYACEEHPSHFSDHLRQAFSSEELKPLTSEVLKILRDHAAMMFRCMYSVTGENKLLDEARLTDLVFEFFDWHPHMKIGEEE